jgi:type III pantothenate kinase
MQTNPVFVVDGGNTHIKLGVFSSGNLTSVHRCSSAREMGAMLTPQSTVVIANVGRQEMYSECQRMGCEVFSLDPLGKLPFANRYLTPASLGIDRLCNVAAAQALHPKQNVLVVDVGTCIKFDLINANGEFSGGSISPGISLRYRSLNDYTANLPLLSPAAWKLIGTNTEESLHSGVMGSALAEITWRIQEYRRLYETLTVYLTGGDAHYFDMDQKNSIFVDENLTLKGIYALYLFQNP